MNDFLPIDSGERAPQRLRRRALDLADDAVGRLGDIAAHPHEAVHDVRRRLKELRALASLLAAGRSEIELFRDAGRRLSAARDNKAALEAFDRLRETFAGEWAPRQFAKIRRALAARAADFVDPAVAGEVRDGLIRERGAIAAWTVDGMTRDELWAAIRRSRRRCRAAMDDAVSEPPSHERFHAWRKRTKTLWYQAQFFTSVGLADLEADAKSLRKLSRMLGDHHDLAVIDDLCSTQPELFGTQRYVNRFRKFVARRLRQLEATSEALGTELFAAPGRDWETRVRIDRRRIGPKRSLPQETTPAAVSA